MESKKIDRVSEIEYVEKGNKVSFEAYVVNIESEGEKERRRPISINVKLKSNDFLKIVTWDYDMLDKLKEAAANYIYINFSCNAKIYNGKNNMILSSCEFTNEKAEVSEPSGTVSNISQYYKKAITSMINSEIQNEMFLAILKDLLTEEFFTWKAARSIHHNFPGGLAMHSYNVAINSLNIFRTYKNFKMLNKELLITGALLHDIGKLDEYQENGNFSLEGSLLSHIPSGIHKVLNSVTKNGFNEKDTLVLQLVHIIASHHGRLEFGASNQPSIPEAVIVSKSDELDAQMETMRTALMTLNLHESSQRLLGIDNACVVKFDKESGE